MASKTTKKKQKTLRQLWYTVFPRKKSWSGEAYYDYNLLACVILLTCFGLVMLYSTSAYTAKVKYGSDMAFFGKQAVISVGCIFGMMAISKADYHWIASWGTLLYGVSNILLFATKYVGEDVNGATRWIKLGPVQFQTADLGTIDQQLLFQTGAFPHDTMHRLFYPRTPTFSLLLQFLFLFLPGRYLF